MRCVFLLINMVGAGAVGFLVQVHEYGWAAFSAAFFIMDGLDRLYFKGGER